MMLYENAAKVNAKQQTCLKSTEKSTIHCGTDANLYTTCSIWMREQAFRHIFSGYARTFQRRSEIVRI